MNSYFKTFSLVLILVMLFSNYSFSSNKSDSTKIDADLGLDLVSRFVWRGLTVNNRPNFQPYFEVGYSNFMVGVWGSYSTSNNYGEVDLYLGYSNSGFTVMVSDYFVENEDNFGEFDYLNWKDKVTGHAVEGTIAYELQGKLPLSFSLNTFLYGFDKKENGYNYYSTWIDVKYLFKINNLDFEAHIGGTPAKGLYSEKEAAITSIGLNATKNIELSKRYNVPLSLSLVINPKAEDVFLTAIIGF